MAFCGKCGTKIEEGLKFCPNCGAPAEAPTEQQAQQTQQTYQQAAPNTGTAQPEPKDVTSMFDPADIEKNKAMGLLAYILFFIPLLAAKDSAFAKFHANQGFVLFLGFIASSVLWIIPILGWIAAPVVYIVAIVLSIMGIINALGGKAINLPIVGKFKIFK